MERKGYEAGEKLPQFATYTLARGQNRAVGTRLTVHGKSTNHDMYLAYIGRGRFSPVLE